MSAAPGRALVAGTGKMGRNIGLHLARNGWRVAWLGRDRERLDRTARWLGRRLRKLGPEAALGFFCLGDPELPAVDIVVEAVEEDLQRKRDLLSALDTALTGAPTLLSTTSSILPGELHPRLSVAHFFYPLEYTGLVELIVGDVETCDLAELLEQAGLMVLRQNERSAFLLNRLLLPLQNACYQALAAGMDPDEVDEASAASPLCPVEQLSLINSVGPRTVAAAVRNYLSRMPAGEAETYAPLVSGLAGEPASPETRRAPRADFARLMLTSCLDALEAGHIDGPTLDLALEKLYGAETTVAAERDRLD